MSDDNGDMNIAKALDISLKELAAPLDNLEPKEIVVAGEEPPVGVTGYDTKDADEDYKEVRQNLKVVIEQSNTAVQSILDLARDVQEPRVYEVLGQLIAQTMEANTKLIDLHRRMKDLKKQDIGSVKNTTVTNNSIFVGSTKDLQSLIKEQRKLVDNEAKVKE